MQSGLAVRLPERYTSDLIYLQDAALGQPDDFEPPGTFGLYPAKTFSDVFVVGTHLAWERSAKAHGYRVLVAESPRFQSPVVERIVCVPEISLADLTPAHQFYWNVVAIGPGGGRTNSGEPQSFRTPELVGRRGIAFASDLVWSKATAGAGNEVHRDKNYANRTITIGGRPYPKGLWTHAFDDQTPADIVYDLTAQKFVKFKAKVGLDDLGERGSVQFQVLVDGRLKAVSPILRPRKTFSLVVDVTDASQVTLRVLNGGDGYGWDHAAWALARFVEAGAKDPFE